MLPSRFAAPALIAGTFVTVFSLAAAADDEAIEEIVVTAGFRDAALMRSGGSVSVLEPLAIEERAARHLEDTLAAVPNVNFSVGGARARFIQMRGIGDLEQFVDPKHYPSVGIIMDGIELSNIATGALMFDTEQVEVLRGPQGTRFGASALAGAVNIRGREPGAQFEASLDAGYGNLDSWFVSAAAGGPLTDDLRARIAVRQNQRDGFIDNDFLGRDDTQDVDETSVRARAVWDVGANTTADATLLYLDADNGYDAFSLDNSRTTLSDEPGQDAQEVVALGVGIRHGLGSYGTAIARVTFTDGEETYSFDEDWVFSGFCDGVRCNPLFEFSSSDRMDRERDQVSLDLRWLNGSGDWSWVAGAYMHLRDEDLERTRFGAFTSRYETHRYALYGQLEYAFAPRWLARAGIRGEAFNDEYSDSNLFDLQSNDTFWSGELALEFTPDENNLLYLTLARGAKPGGVNTSATSVLPFIAPRFTGFIDARRQFDTETVFNKEIGLKGRYFDDRLRLRLSAFHTDRNDAQLESWIWDATTFVFIGMLDNVDDAENYGVELELDAALTQSLSFVSRVGYLETNVERMQVFDLDLDAFRTLDDRDQTKAPNWQYHFGLRWQALEALSAHLSVEGRSDSFFGYYHDEKLDDYALLNLSIAYTWRDARLRLWSRNLLNTGYANHGLYFANDPRDGFAVNRAYRQAAEPRVYGFDVSVTF